MSSSVSITPDEFAEFVKKNTFNDYPYIVFCLPSWKEKYGDALSTVTGRKIVHMNPMDDSLINKGEVNKPRDAVTIRSLKRFYYGMFAKNNLVLLWPKNPDYKDEMRLWDCYAIRHLEPRSVFILYCCIGGDGGSEELHREILKWSGAPYNKDYDDTYLSGRNRTDYKLSDCIEHEDGCAAAALHDPDPGGCMSCPCYFPFDYASFIEQNYNDRLVYNSI